MSGRFGRLLTFASAVASLGAAAALVSCAPGFSPLPRPAPGTLPPGSPLLSHSLPDGAAWLRHYLMVGDYDAALELLDRSSDVAGDKLLRRLQAGVVLHHAGRFEESNRAFEWAEREADLRYTKSLSRAAGSLLINDRVLAYTPSPAELAAILYYRMLNYLALGDTAGALVEARKAGALLERIGGEDNEECIGNGFLHYLSGLVFSAAGEDNAALVSFRQAEQAFDTCAGQSPVAPPPALGRDLVRTARALGFEDIAESATDRYGTAAAEGEGTGELVILIENGFVAHRVEEELYIPIFDSDMAGLSRDDTDDVGTVADRIGERFVEQQFHAGSPYRDYRPDPVLGYREGYGREIEHVLKLAWPAMRLEASRAADVRVRVDSASVEPAPLYDLSLLQARSLESERLVILSRMIARGLVKYLVTNEVEEEVEERSGETAALITGLLLNTAANLVEQADTRSWSLLPDQVAMARIRLLPGEHTVRIDVFDRGGARTRTIDLGTVSIEPGERLFLSQRIWGRYELRDGECGMERQGTGDRLQGTGERQHHPVAPSPLHPCGGWGYDDRYRN